MLNRVTPSFSVRTLSLSALRRGEIEVKEAAPYVYQVALNRPEQRNTFTLGLWKEFHKVIDDLAENPKCRAIVLSGNGKSFCAGIDLKLGATELIKIAQDPELDVSRRARKIRSLVTQCQDSYSSVEKCPKPVIAAIHSHCIGAGINLVSGCDIRYASQDAIFSIREVDIGMAADVGILNRIQKLIGNDSLTRELAYTARDFMADEALRYGFISHISLDRESVLEKAIATAALIAEKSPIGVQGSKLVLNHARDHSIADSLEFVKVWNQSQLLGDDLMKAAMGALQKKKIEFNDV